jgi:hypothetical protein
LATTPNSLSQYAVIQVSNSNIDPAAAQEAIKSVVQRLIWTDSAFAEWLTSLTTMPRPLNSTPAKAPALGNPPLTTMPRPLISTPAKAPALGNLRGSQSSSKRTKLDQGKTREQRTHQAHDSPVHPIGAKRAMLTSPQVTPTKTINDIDTSLNISLTPLNLEEKLKHFEGQETLSDYEVERLINDPQWTGQLWDHKDMFRHSSWLHVNAECAGMEC